MTENKATENMAPFKVEKCAYIESAVQRTTRFDHYACGRPTGFVGWQTKQIIKSRGYGTEPFEGSLRTRPQESGSQQHESR